MSYVLKTYRKMDSSGLTTTTSTSSPTQTAPTAQCNTYSFYSMASNDYETQSALTGTISYPGNQMGVLNNQQASSSSSSPASTSSASSSSSSSSSTSTTPAEPTYDGSFKINLSFANELFAANTGQFELHHHHHHSQQQQQQQLTVIGQVDDVGQYESGQQYSLMTCPQLNLLDTNLLTNTALATGTMVEENDNHIYMNCTSSQSVLTGQNAYQDAVIVSSSENIVYQQNSGYHADQQQQQHQQFHQQHIDETASASNANGADMMNMEFDFVSNLTTLDDLGSYNNQSMLYSTGNQLIETVTLDHPFAKRSQTDELGVLGQSQSKPDHSGNSIYRLTDPSQNYSEVHVNEADKAVTFDPNGHYQSGPKTSSMNPVEILNQILSSGASGLYDNQGARPGQSQQQSYELGNYNRGAAGMPTRTAGRPKSNLDAKLASNKSQAKLRSVVSNGIQKHKKTALAKRISPCNVCGDAVSSGYHYGTFTCEACKLFFRRAMKSLRKTPLPKCDRKSCVITSSNRGTCSECRFKKCVEAGMSMTRSRYGRHTKKICTNYSPDVGGSLCTLLGRLRDDKNLTTVNSKNLSVLNDTIVEFYQRALQLLLSSSDGSNGQDDDDEDDDEADIDFVCKDDTITEKYFCKPTAGGHGPMQTPSSSNMSTLSSYSDHSTTYMNSSPSAASSSQPYTDFSASSLTASMSSQETSTRVMLPKCMIMFFCFLFDIEMLAEDVICYNNTSIGHKKDLTWFMKESKYREILNEFKEFRKFIQESILERHEICLTLKIALFLKTMRVLLENNLLKDDLYDKRISDLMKSELALIYMNRQNQTGSSERAPRVTMFSNGSLSSQGSFDQSGQLTGAGSEQQLSLSSSLNNSLLSCFSIFARINLLVLKHMNNEELEFFVFQKCFSLYKS